MTYKFAVYCLSTLLITDFSLIISLLLFPQGDRVNDGFGQGIMAAYSVVGLFLLTVLGVLFLISFFKKSYKSIEILAWLMVIGNSFVVFGILSFIISAILQKI